ncbi:MAG: rod shape-determining protein MreC [Clostridia bacterium]|nr:rod shape-determining protein MreC [Clostridia bacterium]MDQ7791484.1 rod shape-determining protein MreC [Clostridia bacterium]
MRRTWWKRILAAVTLVGVLIAAMFITVPERKELTVLESALRDVVAPVQTGLTFVSEEAFSRIRSVFTLGRSAETDELRKRIRNLEGELVSLEEFRLENERLRALLVYRDGQDQSRLLLARVVGRDPGNWFSTIRVNCGSEDGVRQDMVVVLPSGLVGRVLAVAEQTSDVLLITDARSGVGTLVQDTRLPGVVKGSLDRSGRLRMSYLTREEDVEPNQAVVTSGLGGVFPKGIPVGRVVSVSNDPSGLTRSAEVIPMVDFDHLEEVFIILSH